MVQFLPQTTKGRLIEETGKGLGSGIGDVLQEATEYKRNRGRLQEALKSIENISPEDRKNPTKLLTALISATAGIPGAEKYVGPVFETMSRYTQARAASGEGLPEETPTPMQGAGKPIAGQQFQIPGKQIGAVPTTPTPSIAPTPVTQPGVGQGQLQVPAQPGLSRQGFINAPTHDFLRKQEIAAGGTGELTDQRVAKINQTVNEGRKLDQEDRNWIIENQQLEKARENEFKQFADPLVQQEFGELAPLEQVRFYQYAKDIDTKSTENGVLLRPNDLYEKSRKRLNDYLTYKGNLEGVPKQKINPATGAAMEVYEGGIDTRPMFFGRDSSKYKEITKKLHNDVKPLVEMGEADEARNILSNKGYFADEIEDVINPLTDETKKAFTSIGRGDEIKAAFGKAAPERYEKARESNINKLEKGLKNSLKADTSLVLLMREAERMGYDYTEFDEALQKLVEGGYTLSPQQTRDRPTLNKPSMDFLRKVFG